MRTAAYFLFFFCLRSPGSKVFFFFVVVSPMFIFEEQLISRPFDWMVGCYQEKQEEFSQSGLINAGE